MRVTCVVTANANVYLRGIAKTCCVFGPDASASCSSPLWSSSSQRRDQSCGHRRITINRTSCVNVDTAYVQDRSPSGGTVGKQPTSAGYLGWDGGSRSQCSCGEPKVNMAPLGYVSVVSGVVGGSNGNRAITTRASAWVRGVERWNWRAAP